MKNEVKIAVVDKKQEPEIPIKRPRKTQDRKLKKGKITKNGPLRTRIAPPTSLEQGGVLTNLKFELVF
jgi:hypothetical protein